MKNNSVKIAVLIGFIGAVLISIFNVSAINHSHSSTAVVGFVFLPFVFLIAFAGFFIFGYCACYLKTWYSTLPRVLNLKIICAFLTVTFGVGSFIKLAILIFLTSQINATSSSEFLAEKFHQSYFRSNKFVLGAIAQNQATTSEILDEIARLDDKELHESMNTIFPLLGDNTTGYAVMCLVAYHKNTLPQTIEYLAHTSQNEYVLGDIAANSKTSPETLKELEEKKNYLIDWGLASNRNTPSDVFPKLLTRNDKYTNEALLRNPAVSPEIKYEVCKALGDSDLKSKKCSHLKKKLDHQ